MAPLIEISESVLKTLNPKNYTRRADLENKSTEKDLSGFIHVPSINLYVAKEKIHLGKNWFNCHKELQKNNERMLIIPEFIEFLKYAKINFPDTYKDITEVRDSWRAEFLDADFKVKNGKLHINYAHVLDSNMNLIPKTSEILDSNTLMQDKTPGISLESWLKAPTKQGLPNKNVEEGNLYYYFPRSDNNSVARFNAGSDGAVLVCSRSPFDTDSHLGVRACKRENKK